MPSEIPREPRARHSSLFTIHSLCDEIHVRCELTVGLIRRRAIPPACGLVAAWLARLECSHPEWLMAEILTLKRTASAVRRCSAAGARGRRTGAYGLTR